MAAKCGRQLERPKTSQGYCCRRIRAIDPASPDTTKTWRGSPRASRGPAEERELGEHQYGTAGQNAGAAKGLRQQWPAGCWCGKRQGKWCCVKFRAPQGSSTKARADPATRRENEQWLTQPTGFRINLRTARKRYWQLEVMQAWWYSCSYKKSGEGILAKI